MSIGPRNRRCLFTGLLPATTAVTATDLSALGGKTAGTVTVTNAVVISGTATQIMAALDTDETKVTASTAVVNITGSASVQSNQKHRISTAKSTWY